MLKSCVALFFFGASLLPAQTGEGHHAFKPHGWFDLHGDSTVGIEHVHPDGRTGPVTGRPLSANEVRQTIQTLSDGTPVSRTEVSAFHRDAQGRTRTESATRIIIYDPVAGFTYNLDKPAKTFEKYAVHEAIEIHHGQHTAEYHEQASTSEDLPAQLVNGINATGSRVTLPCLPAPPGTIRSSRS